MITEKGRIEEALSKYNLDVNDEDVKAAVKKIITEKVHENGSAVKTARSYVAKAVCT